MLKSEGDFFLFLWFIVQYLWYLSIHKKYDGKLAGC